MVNSRPYSATGPMRGRKRLLVPLGAFAGLSDGPGEEACEQGDAEEDQDGLGDGPQSDVQRGAVQAQPAGEHVEIEPAEHRVHGDLEHRVDRDEDRGEFAAAERQVVPDQDHGDAAGEPDDDQTGAQFGEVGEEHPGEGEHEQRADHPVEQQGDTQGAAIRELVADVRVADLGENRVHHGQQPDGDRQRDGVDLDVIERVVEVGDQPSEADAGGHGEDDPDR